MAGFTRCKPMALDAVSSFSAARHPGDVGCRNIRFAVYDSGGSLAMVGVGVSHHPFPWLLRMAVLRRMDD